MQQYGPYDLLFVHRDAENRDYKTRTREIEQAFAKAEESTAYVPVIPIRMTEAWLLFDEVLIRKAAGNPNGRMALSLPGPATLERLQNPKATLRTALVTASSSKPRLRKLFDVNHARQRVAELAQDFSPLRQLTAFQHFERDLAAAIDSFDAEERASVSI